MTLNINCPPRFTTLETTQRKVNSELPVNDEYFRFRTLPPVSVRTR